ncbi:hypothetical protein A2773_05220 [Candidatus Gottesmanbacteria bacterium RIFCSPHIGHO2_01_FULL_39_10]|uniref:Sortase n=1 Tax=Candidatus Gottesmanbacteria bacterium RIFCSPHIGHO2_01_FULL_39_10 TaxID=1798375 RepID=A0A1F5ZP17_9BACT|nr:MAG: hypothetical protein A2773_05220 [Candidatus Gottesmanbacteria bacterium RIFCSPHIGHO2_01_FULL_39_10]
MISRSEKIKFVILRTFGNFLILFALFGMGMTFGPAGWEEAQYRYRQFRNVHYVVAEEKKVEEVEKVEPTSIPTQVPPTFFGQLTGGNKVEELRPVDPYFSVVIPKIGANAKVIPNVNAADSDEYLSALEKGVAHASGTDFPGGRSTVYLFAHSTDSFWNVGRYNAVFYLLKELNPGDEINVFFARVRHKYKVVERRIVSPNEVNYLTDKSPYEQLILQTCWPPGTTLERLLVIARPESEI